MEFVSGNILIRPNTLATKGEKLPGHAHGFDHTTIVFSGAVRVKAAFPDGRIVEQDFTAPSHFLVKADVEHEIEALENETVVWCVYSHRTPQGEVIQENIGWMPAYG